MRVSGVSSHPGSTSYKHPSEKPSLFYRARSPPHNNHFESSSSFSRPSGSARGDLSAPLRLTFFTDSFFVLPIPGGSNGLINTSYAQIASMFDACGRELNNWDAFYTFHFCLSRFGPGVMSCIQAYAKNNESVQAHRKCKLCLRPMKSTHGNIRPICAMIYDDITSAWGVMMCTLKIGPGQGTPLANPSKSLDELSIDCFLYEGMAHTWRNNVLCSTSQFQDLLGCPLSHAWSDPIKRQRIGRLAVSQPEIVTGAVANSLKQLKHELPPVLTRSCYTNSRHSIGIWKQRQGRKKEWRMHPFRGRRRYLGGIPIAFLKQYTGFHPLYVEKWPHHLQERHLPHAIEYEDCYFPDDEAMPFPEDKFQNYTLSWEPQDVKRRLGSHSTPRGYQIPYESYVGAILGGQFQLGEVISENAASQETVYSITALLAPGEALEARSYDFAGLSGGLLKSRQRHMRRLSSRQICRVDQAGKKFLIYRRNTTSQTEREKSIGIWCSKKVDVGMAFEMPMNDIDIEFPLLSDKKPRIAKITLWESSKAKALFGRSSDLQEALAQAGGNISVTKTERDDITRQTSDRKLKCPLPRKTRRRGKRKPKAKMTLVDLENKGAHNVPMMGARSHEAPAAIEDESPRLPPRNFPSLVALEKYLDDLVGDIDSLVLQIHHRSLDIQNLTLQHSKISAGLTVHDASQGSIVKMKKMKEKCLCDLEQFARSQKLQQIRLHTQIQHLYKLHRKPLEYRILFDMRAEKSAELQNLKIQIQRLKRRLGKLSLGSKDWKRINNILSTQKEMVESLPREIDYMTGKLEDIIRPSEEDAH